MFNFYKATHGQKDKSFLRFNETFSPSSDLIKTTIPSCRIFNCIFKIFTNWLLWRKIVLGSNIFPENICCSLIDQFLWFSVSVLLTPSLWQNIYILTRSSTSHQNNLQQRVEDPSWWLVNGYRQTSSNTIQILTITTLTLELSVTLRITHGRVHQLLIRELQLRKTLSNFVILRIIENNHNTKTRL